MTKYYISPTGLDTNNGLSSTTAFATLSKAANTVVAGDEVEVGAGSYYNQPTAYFQNLAGSATAYTKIYAAANTEPLLYFPNVFGLQILNSSYVSVYGLTLLGNAPSLSYSGAYAKKDVYDVVYSASGITIRETHHVRVKACTVRDFPGAGIYFGKCDYVECLNNTVSGNTLYSPYGTQGISFHKVFNSPGAVSGEERLVAKYNHSYNNINLIPWSTALGGNGLYEGAGIYNDTTKTVDDGSTYTGVAVFAFNCSNYNGAAGLHALNACPTKYQANFINSNQRNQSYSELHINSSPGSSVLDNEVCTDSDRSWLYAGNIPNIQVTNNTVRATTAYTINNCPGSNVSNNTFL